jgi:Ras-related protein Rab-8A
MNEVEKHASDNISRILVGNKSDMEDARQVSTEEGKEQAEHYNVRFLETSAKDCKNVEEAFTIMTREIKSRVAITQPTKRAVESKIQQIFNQSNYSHKHWNKDHSFVVEDKESAGQKEPVLLIG